MFQQILMEIVRCCMEQKLIDGKEMASDSSYIPAEVSRNSWINIEVEVEQSMLSYLDDLDQELASQPGFKKLASHTVTKKITTSTTDPGVCAIRNGSKNSWGCLWRKLLWTKGMILVRLTGVWNYWELPVIFPPSVFPMPQVKMDFHIIRNRIHLFAQWDSLLYITV